MQRSTVKVWAGVIGCVCFWVDLTWVAFRLDKAAAAMPPADMARLCRWSRRAAGLTALWSLLMFVRGLIGFSDSLATIPADSTFTPSLALFVVAFGAALWPLFLGLAVLFLSLAVTWMLERVWERRQAPTAADV